MKKRVKVKVTVEIEMDGKVGSAVDEGEFTQFIDMRSAKTWGITEEEIYNPEEWEISLAIGDGYENPYFFANIDPPYGEIR